MRDQRREASRPLIHLSLLAADYWVPIAPVPTRRGATWRPCRWAQPDVTTIGVRVVLIDPDAFGTGIEGALDRYVSMTRATRQLVILMTHTSRKHSVNTRVRPRMGVVRVQGFKYSNVVRRLPMWHTSQQSLSEAELCYLGEALSTITSTTAPSGTGRTPRSARAPLAHSGPTSRVCVRSRSSWCVVYHAGSSSSRAGTSASTSSSSSPDS